MKMESKEIRGLMEAYASIYEGYGKDKDKKKKKMHDCATHGEHSEWGAGVMIKEMHTLDEDGNITHYDVVFEHGIEKNVPVEELNITMSERHEHFINYDKNAEVLDEDSASLSAAARRRAQEMGAKRRRTPAYKAGGNRGTGRNERAAYDLSNKQKSAAANPETQRTRSRRPSTEDTGMHPGDFDRYNRKDPKKNPKHEANNETSTESYDLFDHILEHLVAEGYADTNKAALAIMANMSEEWKESILDESRGAELRAKHGDNPSKKLETKAFGKAMSYDNRDRLPTGTGTEVRARYLGLSGRARSRARGETPASSAVSPDNESRTVRSRGGRARGIGAGENRDRPTG